MNHSELQRNRATLSRHCTVCAGHFSQHGSRECSADRCTGAPQYQDFLRVNGVRTDCCLAVQKKLCVDCRGDSKRSYSRFAREPLRTEHTCSVRHSCRNASMGSSRAARSAGNSRKPTPTAAEKPNEISTNGTDTRGWRCSRYSSPARCRSVRRVRRASRGSGLAST
jgi:hypothetical protein